MPLFPLGRTACAEPQCLYKGALHLSLTDEVLGQSDVEALKLVLQIKNNFTYVNFLIQIFKNGQTYKELEIQFTTSLGL
jgi:hypothetical protein